MKATDASARTERLIAKRREASAEKQGHTLEVIKMMLLRRDKVTFVEVQRAARVSTWFVYNNAAIRTAIEEAMREQRADQPMLTTRKTDDRSSHGLRAELADARAEIRDLRSERELLRKRLQRNLGEHVNALAKQELLERLRVVEGENKQLQKSLLLATTEQASARRAAQQAQTELDGARLALRQMMRTQRPGPG